MEPIELPETLLQRLNKNYDPPSQKEAHRIVWQQLLLCVDALKSGTDPDKVAKFINDSVLMAMTYDVSFWKKLGIKLSPRYRRANRIAEKALFNAVGIKLPRWHDRVRYWFKRKFRKEVKNE